MRVQSSLLLLLLPFALHHAAAQQQDQQQQRKWLIVHGTWEQSGSASRNLLSAATLASRHNMQLVEPYFGCAVKPGCIGLKE